MWKNCVGSICMLCFFVSVAGSNPQSEEVLDNKQDVTILSNGNVSVDFRNMEIQNVLKIFAHKGGVNIVMDPAVKGLVTLQLKEIPWKEALNIVVRTYGYAYEYQGSVIVVTTIEGLKKMRENAILLTAQEEMETQTYILNFAKAEDVAKSLQTMRSSRGSVNFDVRTNIVIVTDILSRQKSMSIVIERLDATTDQVLIEAKIVETSFSDTENMGINWITQASVTGSSRPTTFPFKGQAGIGESLGRFLPTTMSEIPEFAFGTLNFSQLSAVFEALKGRTDTNVLSSPRIVTLDNKSAEILVGEQYPFPEYTYNAEQATLQISGWEYKDIGVLFRVTPHVNNAGYITLDVKPEVSSIGSSVIVSSTSVPRINTQTTETTVMIEDGSTLVIGGLVTSREENVKKRIPLLGSIPLLGRIFTKSEIGKSKTDLLIFITPHIITPDINKVK